MAKEEKEKEVASLIPRGEVYLANNLNVLLIGLHGTGKTVTIMDLCNKNKLKMKYYSCSTLDPYTDLVGVPVPMAFCPSCSEYHHQEKSLCPTCETRTEVALKMVRPRDVDEAEFIFFDEFNRADSKTTNAVFEIIQFRSINGEPLPHLRCCWAAINPPDHDYHVEEVDPALMDRFDLYIEIKPRPSIAYMTANGLTIDVARALKSWWDDQDRKRRDFESYVSPRRLLKVGQVYTQTGNSQDVKNSLPIAGKFEITKLTHMLEIATGKKQVDIADLGKAAADFKYTPGGLIREKAKISEYLQNHPNELETHQKVIDVFTKTGIGADTLIRGYGILLDAVQPALLETFIHDLPSAKQTQLRKNFVDLKSSNPSVAKELPNLEKILAKNARIDGLTP